MSLLGFKKSIKSTLASVATRVYAQRAVENATYPYVTFSIADTDPIDTRKDFTLDVDVWDTAQDTTVLENLAAGIISKLDYHWYNDAACYWHSYLYSYNEIDDPDDRIKRRHLEFIIRSYI
jgi:hypothetical protein